MYRFLLISCSICILFFAYSCSNTQNATKVQHKVETTRVKPANVTLNGKVYTAIFLQRAAEYKAQCYQAYNLAGLYVTNYTPQTLKPLAIITDIDETVLNNSAYAVKQAYQGKEYDHESWNIWVNLANADTIPGAYRFFTQAHTKGIEIFYITNRFKSTDSATLANLQKYGFPNADAVHLLSRTNESSKAIRRNVVAATHEIVLLLGDNLADFSDLYDGKKTEQERSMATDALSKKFGAQYIIIPNWNYGDWEGAFLNYNYKLTAAQKDSVIQSKLISY